jgi:hypothetical protein
MFRPQPVADVGLTALEHGVLVDKVLLTRFVVMMWFAMALRIARSVCGVNTI